MPAQECDVRGVDYAVAVEVSRYAQPVAACSGECAPEVCQISHAQLASVARAHNVAAGEWAYTQRILAAAGAADAWRCVAGGAEGAVMCTGVYFCTVSWQGGMAMLALQAV